MRALIEIVWHLRLEGHGSSLLVKGLGVALKAVTDKPSDASPALRRRLLNRLLRLFGLA